MLDGTLLGILDWVAQHDPPKTARGYAELALLQLRGKTS
jgi:hypothetical protein